MAKLELEGLDVLIDKVNKLGSHGDKIKQNTLKQAGDRVKSSMEKKAPRSKERKKHMADHIQVSDIEKGDGVDFIRIGPNKGDNSEFFYSKFTEWGTSKIPAQHWAMKSVQENKEEINKIIRKELQKGLDAFDK